ncbi:hypothetical protein BDF14DRAFT_1993964 [Spinellus fusiger]|nr:hypothetical protein BDF14DRAFT_1993964 [Spinellus fusiger]
MTLTTSRGLCKPPRRIFSSDHIPQPVYLGVDIVINSNRKSYYTVSVHDGSYTTENYSGELSQHNENSSEEEHILEAWKELGRLLLNYSTTQHYKVQLVAFSKDSACVSVCGHAHKETAMTDFWKELDALPFCLETHGKSPDERASAAVRKAVICLSPQYPGNLPRISVGFRHKVYIDFDNAIHFVDLKDYKNTVSKETWRVWEAISETFKRENKRVSFFNSTPQGGGVALMRHALLRFYHLNDIDVQWYVTRPKPEIFNITKRKFHNILQGIADPQVRLSEEDKKTFIAWSEENAKRFWMDHQGPIRNSDVIVIDDPQLCGIISYIKEVSPNTRIIFRSHIEIRADLIREQPEGHQVETWNFLWNFIQHADLFVCHPIHNFIPDIIPRRNVVYMPACTDLLDGLNKPFNERCISYYRGVFNRVCLDQCVEQVDWKRPYIVQVARFDPSKGIPDVMESYRLLRERMQKEGWDIQNVPQLVICGHSSIDDPDGSVVYEQAYDLVQQSSFISIAQDIIIVRLPSFDQLLNIILRGAYVALQLSHREGFEVKVTEALAKGVPVVAYKAGGIPLQIKEGITGYLVSVGDVQTVSDSVFHLFSNKQLYERMNSAAKTQLTEEYFTVWNAMSWTHIFNEITVYHGPSQGLLDKEATFQHNSGTLGNSCKVSDSWKHKYHYQ